MLWLDGKVALVTGGASGIGRAVVDRFVAEGAKVVVLDRAAPGLDALTRAHGAKVLPLVGDVTVLTDNERAVAAALDRFGRLDTVIGNAGIHDAGTPILDLPRDRLETAFDEMMAVNVKGCLFAAYAAGPALKKSGGTMVLTSSMSGIGIGRGGVIYTASKHAVVGLVRRLAHEWAPGVRVNGVAAGMTITGLRVAETLGGAALFAGRDPSGALRPEDHAPTYLLLASDQSRPITGVVIPTDAGAGVGVKRPSA